MLYTYLVPIDYLLYKNTFVRALKKFSEQIFVSYLTFALLFYKLFIESCPKDQRNVIIFFEKPLLWLIYVLKLWSVVPNVTTLHFLTYSSVPNKRPCTFIFFSHFSPSLYFLFGSIFLIVFQGKKMVCDNFFIKS